MRIAPMVAGLAAGAALGLGGVVAAELATENADAQSGGQGLTQNIEAEITSANLRSQRGIKQATTVWNQLGIYLAPKGTQIRAKGPRVSQRKAVGGGLPITVLDQETQNKINAGGPAGPPGPQGPPGPSEPNVFPFNIGLNRGEDQTFAQTGPISLQAVCGDAGGGLVQPRILARTTEPAATSTVAMFGIDVLNGSVTGFLNNLTPAAGRRLAEGLPVDPTVTSSVVPGGAVFMFTTDADGHYIGLDNNTALGVGYSGTDCVFRGFYTQQVP